MSKTHYIPPLTSAEFGNANPESNFIYLSTPNDSDISYTIRSDSEGWNVTFKGTHLPAIDYWFSVELVDLNGNIRLRKGHFSLIRR